MTMTIAASNWGWPQYVYLILAFLSLFGHITNHGKQRHPYNGYLGLCNFLIAFCLLTAGGFFA
ncbi:hypothetical protein RWA06_04745 [Sinorhizobium meliloti]|uniref:hypothetical protein n=1 Tax=Rhizobium meliloti TaxID=382 RepID=UPI00299E2534|nr:hypothetical protein [Sinorhizobium meliloti]